MADTTYPKPIPVGSAKLRDQRYTAEVLGPKMFRNGIGYRSTLEEARFLSLPDCVRWADAVHPGAEVIMVTHYAARTGWKSVHTAERRDGAWRSSLGATLNTTTWEWTLPPQVKPDLLSGCTCGGIGTTGAHAVGCAWGRQR